jgi:hypothetical protein
VVDEDDNVVVELVALVVVVVDPLTLVLVELVALVVVVVDPLTLVLVKLVSRVVVVTVVSVFKFVVVDVDVVDEDVVTGGAK